MPEAFICDAVRTPIGRYGGALSAVRADDLAAIPLTALMVRNPIVDWSAVDDLVYGCANQAGEDNRNVGRMAVLLAGMPISVPGTTVNRLCGSGMDAVGMAARAIKAGDCDFVIAGGVESMTRAPFVMPKADERLVAFQCSLRHHHRLALRQSGDEEAVWRRLDAADGRQCRRRIQRFARRIRTLSPRARRRAGPQRRKPAVFTRRDRADHDSAKEG